MTLTPPGGGSWPEEQVCCRGCTTAQPPLSAVERVLVTVHEGGRVRATTGEVTTCPYLVVTTSTGPGWVGVVLTHVPTGRCLPLRAWTSDVGVLHRVAELLAGLDWSSADPASYAGYVRPVIAAVDQAPRRALRRCGFRIGACLGWAGQGVVVMSVLVALIVFSAVGAVICTKARAAGPAVFFGVVAVALFAATPLGAELPGAVTAMFEAFNDASAGGGAP